MEEALKEKTGSPHVVWMSVVAVEVFRASRPAADFFQSQGALQRSSDWVILSQSFERDLTWPTSSPGLKGRFEGIC